MQVSAAIRQGNRIAVSALRCGVVTITSREGAPLAHQVPRRVAPRSAAPPLPATDIGCRRDGAMHVSGGKSLPTLAE
jgi:hypothetical protein